MNTIVEVEDITVAYDTKPVLWDIDLNIPEGKLVAIVGPNGAGKTTLLKTLLHLIKPISGEVRFPLKASGARGYVGYVPQSNSVDWDFPTTALDVALMGSYGRLGWFRRPKKEDIAFAKKMLDKVGMGEYCDRQISRLSGGQQQRVFLARALVQDAQLYFMDEPFKGVDAKTERVIVDLMKELQAQGKTIVVVHHDLETVCEYFDHLVLINVRLIAQGEVSEVFTDENIKKTYQVQAPLLKKEEDYE